MAAKLQKKGKTGRNDPCPCGSGSKFKKCCLQPSGKGRLELANSLISSAICKLPEVTAQLIDRVYEAKFSGYWHTDAESMLIKSLYQISSLLRLREPAVLELGEKRVAFVDFPSVWCVARAMFERLTTFAYIFRRPEGDERDFWHTVWRIHAFKERTEDHAVGESLTKPGETLRDVNPDFFANAERSLERLKDELKRNSFFRGPVSSVPNPSPKKPSHTTNCQRQALDGDWRSVLHPSKKLTYEDLAVVCGLTRHFGTVFYSLASNYAHSGALSIFQVRDAETTTDQLRVFDSALTYAGVFHAKLLEIYCELYKEVPGVREIMESVGFDLRILLVGADPIAARQQAWAAQASP